MSAGNGHSTDGAAPRQIRLQGAVPAGAASRMDLARRGQARVRVELRDSDGTRLFAGPAHLAVCDGTDPESLCEMVVQIEAVAVVDDLPSEETQRTTARLGEIARASVGERDVPLALPRGQREASRAELRAERNAAMRRERYEGATISELAARYGVSDGHVYAVLRGEG